MHFLDPLALSLFALAGPLLLLYFIRVRRRERRVGSLLLWALPLRQRVSTSFFQRLERDPLILLQLLILLLLALALARPAITVMGEGERKVVVILDTSASMKARDVFPSRFAEAQSRAASLVRSLRAGTEVMVIEAEIQPRVATEMGRDHRRALDAISAASARDLPNGLADALRVARALIGDDANAEIHVFTDGSGALPVGSAAGSQEGAGGQGGGPVAADMRINWVSVGKGDDNVAITGISVRRTYQGAANYEAFLALANFSTEPKNFNLVLKVEDRTVAERKVQLAGHVKRAMILPFRHAGAARIKAEISASDDLAVDNTAWAVLPPPNKIAVTLVSTGNLFLEKVLKADPEVVLEVKTPQQYAGGMGTADVVVLDSVTPPKVGPGRFILVNTVPPDVPVDILGQVDKPTVLDWDRSHPVMRNVDFSKIAIDSAMRLRPLVTGRPLVEAELGGALVYALEENDRKAVLLGFDLFKADLPLRVAFPLFMWNSLRWLHPGGLDHASLQLASGQPVVMPVAHGVDAMTVSTPGGRKLDGRITRGLASFTDTGEAGVYAVATSRSGERGSTSLVAANLMDSVESDIAPRPLPQGRSSVTGSSVPVERELWPLFVVLALMLLVAEALLYWRRQTGGVLTRLPRDREDRAALLLRAGLIALLCSVFARPSLPQTLDRMNVVFLVDLSDSVSQASRERALGFMEAAVKAARPGDQHGVVVFGADVGVEQPLAARTALAAPGERAAAINAKGTNIYQAMQLALAMLPAGQANRIVLVSDGRQNAGSAFAGAQALKDARADLHYIASPAAGVQEVVAEELVMPREVKFGEPFNVKVVAWSQRETAGRIALYRNGQFVGSQPVKLVPGRNIFSYRQSLDKEGVQVYQASVEADGDGIVENNRAIGTVLVHGRPMVLLADKDKGNAASLAAALRAQQLDVTLVEPSGIPRDMASLQKYDGIILSNVSAIQLDRQRMGLIRDYVRDQGGGLIMVGGDQSFGLGGYYQTPIEEALPVSMEVKQRVDVPNLSIVLSIDRSDSMTTRVNSNSRISYLDLAKEAAHVVVDLLDDNSEVGVMSWDTEWQWEVPIRQASNKAAIHQGIASIVSGKATDGFPALRESYNVLQKRPAVLKHVIFLSDGQMRTEQFPPLVQAMARDQITVSTVAVGRFADEKLLGDIARWGRGRFYKTEDSQSLPRIFAVETQLASNSTAVEQQFRPKLLDRGHEAMQNIDWRSMPPLNGYVATTMKGNAEQVLTSHWEDPVLATWRYGLGRTAAFTSDVNPRWAGQWLQWREYNRFWAQLVRWTLRSATAPGTTATVTGRDGSGEVLVDAQDAKGNFVNFLDAQVGVVSPDRERRVIDLEQIGPGRYRGRFAAEREGVYLLGMAQRVAQRDLGSQVASLVVPYAQELRELGSDELLLRELSGLTGGGALSDPAEVFLKGRRPFHIAQEIWPWIVGIVALLLILDIAVRRFGLGLFGWLRLLLPRRKS
jgi:Ca-activated chloride channel family protein